MWVLIAWESVDSINPRAQLHVAVKHFRIVQISITLGLILCIVGGTSATSTSGGAVQVPTTSKVGIILYILAYAAVCFICFLSTTNISYAGSGEKRLALVVVLALPFILVRLVYSALTVFKHDHDFNFINGSVVLLVVMAVMEEIVVVHLYLILGFFVEKQLPGAKGPLVSRPWKAQR
jgi:hypothetical protein